MINFIKKYNTLTVAAASLFLLGCGGGGGTEALGQQPVQEPVQIVSEDPESSLSQGPVQIVSEDIESDLPQWSVQIVAEDTQSNLLFDNDRLGQLEVASNELDTYDLKSMPRPFTKNNEGELLPFLSVNFLQEGKNYATDFHNTETKYDEWTFTVNSNPERTVTLRWNGNTVTSYTDASGRVRFDQTLQIDESLMERMRLVDAETNATLVSAYADGKLQSYTFNMNGQITRTFRWELDTEKVTENVQVASVRSNALYKGVSAKQYALESDSQIDITTLPRPMGR